MGCAPRPKILRKTQTMQHKHIQKLLHILGECLEADTNQTEVIVSRAIGYLEAIQDSCEEPLIAV